MGVVRLWGFATDGERRRLPLADLIRDEGGAAAVAASASPTSSVSPGPVTVVVDGGWARYESSSRSDDAVDPLAVRSLSAKLVAALPRTPYAVFDGRIRTFLSNLVLSGVERIVLVIDGPFAVMKEGEERDRKRSRLADAWMLQTKWAEGGDAGWVRATLTEDKGFLPRQVCVACFCPTGEVSRCCPFCADCGCPTLALRIFRPIQRQPFYADWGCPTLALRIVRSIHS